MTSSPTPSEFTIRATQPTITLPFPTVERLEQIVKAGGRIVWDWGGLRREVPAEVVLNLGDYLRDLDRRTPHPTLDSMGPLAGSIAWTATRELPAD